MNPAQEVLVHINQIRVKIKMAFTQGKWNQWCCSYRKQWKALEIMQHCRAEIRFVEYVQYLLMLYDLFRHFNINDIMTYRASNYDINVWTCRYFRH